MKTTDKPKSIYKLDWYATPEKEEEWITRMCDKGYALSNMWFCGLICKFDPCRPGEYQYRLEWLADGKHSRRGRDYLDFLEEIGIECIYSFAGIAYYRKKQDGKPFEIYTDKSSEIEHCRRKALMFGFVGAIDFFAGLFVTALLIYILLLGKQPSWVSALWMTISGLAALIFGVHFIQIAIHGMQRIKKLSSERDSAGEFLLEHDKKTRKNPLTSPSFIFTITVMLLAIIAGILWTFIS